MSHPTFIIGIDLGTTNSVISYARIAPPADGPPSIEVMEIPQTVSPGVVEARPTLPSFLFAPGPSDVSPGAIDLPWEPCEDFTVGVFAKDRGAEIPKRLISSSKSWLCHPQVDRNQPILPWKSPEECPKLSPVAASARILEHIRKAWNHVMSETNEGGDGSLAIEHQDIYVTVPASFDAAARELTLKAAETAGFSNITLLEEPTAAFYAWLHDSGDGWRHAVHEGDVVLVCDIGGGTSDFSLIRVEQSEGDLVLERVAVGNHLLVGGDNMDLTLAYSLSHKLSQSGTRLDARQLQVLSHTCRTAKEQLFSGEAAESVPIAILGSGSSLIGGTIRTDLSRNELEGVILEGFFPSCPKDTVPKSHSGTGLREFGLSYETDPAVTHHLADFLRRFHDAEGTRPLEPTAVLFNGGVMKAESLRTRVLDVLGEWSSASGVTPVREIDATDYDLSVARGAAYYGLASRGRGIRIRSGLNRSYYLGIAASMPAVPGIPAPMKALCIAPFGMEEGTTIRVPDQEFMLVVGEPVSFDLLGATARHGDAAGETIEGWENEISPVASIETTLAGEPGAVIPVSMEIRHTEVGTLEVWCVSLNDGLRWKLEFNVRERDA